VDLVGGDFGWYNGASTFLGFISLSTDGAGLLSIGVPFQVFVGFFFIANVAFCAIYLR
jgi:hypothetical protein